jgi:proteasome lid subunit RPN8/RPN11
VVNPPPLPPDLQPVVEHLQRCYPNEGCGVLIHGPQGWRTRPLLNAYDRYHARDPKGFPRTARTAYFFDPREWMAVSEEADRNGETVACVFHSHADVGAYFSAEDRAMAAPDGEPVIPGVTYLVVAVDDGRATDAKLFWWKNSDFAEVDVRIPAPST